MTVARKRVLYPIELPNGAKVVCRHCFLSIAQAAGLWLHVFNRQRLCNPAQPRGYDAAPYKVSPRTRY